MRAVLSPYHLTTRDPAAMAALLLAQRILTFLPIPPGGISRPDVRAALHKSPPYSRLLESWRWAAELFEAGVISSVEPQDNHVHDPLIETRAVQQRIFSQGWVGLRPFMHEHASDADEESEEGGGFGSTPDYLDDLSMDLLKGGPDPGWSLPIIAGLDAFAASNSWFTIRAGQAPGPRAGKWRGSLAQLAESRLARPLCSCAIPILNPLLTDAHTVLLARSALADALAPLAARLAAPDAHSPQATADLRSASRAYAAAFDRYMASLLPTPSRRAADQPPPHQLVRITVAGLPADAALIAASAATGRPGALPKSSSREPTLRALIIEPMALKAAMEGHGPPGP